MCHWKARLALAGPTPTTQIARYDAARYLMVAGILILASKRSTQNRAVNQGIDFSDNMKETDTANQTRRNRINTRRLEAFYAVGLTGTVSAAAEMLHLTQPAVSKQISNLEKDIGYTLFRRTAGRLAMTTEACYLFDEVASALGHLDTLWDAMHQLRRLNIGELAIGTPPGPSFILIPQLLQSFILDRPDIKIKLLAGTSQNIQKQISLQQLDLAIVEYSAVSTANSTNYRVIPLSVNCVCAISNEHPLAKKSIITPRDLDGMPAVTLEPEHSVVRQQKLIFKRSRFVLNPRYEVSLWWAGLGLVRQGLCYALIDRINAEAFQIIDQKKSIKFIDFQPEIIYEFAILIPTIKPLSALTEEFLKLLIGMFKLPTPNDLIT